MTPAACRVALPSGLRINVLHWRPSVPSRASEPPAVLVHGLGDCAWVWQGVAPALAERRHVLSLDLRGHGHSDHVDGGHYSVDAMAHDVLSVLERERLEQALLVGHSLGAAVAIRAASEAPQRVGALALVDYALDVAPASIKLVRSVLAMMHTTYASVADYASILKRRHLLAHPHVLDAIAGAALKPVDGGHQPRFDRSVLEALCDRDTLASATQRLAHLRMPVLVVRGALSSMVSMPAAQALARACPSAQLAVVPMAGHSVQIDNPLGLLKALAGLAEAAALSPR